MWHFSELVEKDNNPKWNPSRLEDVSDDLIDKYFAPFDDSAQELGLKWEQAWLILQSSWTTKKLKFYSRNSCFNRKFCYCYFIDFITHPGCCFAEFKQPTASPDDWARWKLYNAGSTVRITNKNLKHGKILNRILPDVSRVPNEAPQFRTSSTPFRLLQRFAVQLRKESKPYSSYNSSN